MKSWLAAACGFGSHQALKLQCGGVGVLVMMVLVMMAVMLAVVIVSNLINYMLGGSICVVGCGRGLTNNFGGSSLAHHHRHHPYHHHHHHH